MGKKKKERKSMTKSFWLSRAIEMLIHLKFITKSEDKLFGEVIPTLEMEIRERKKIKIKVNCKNLVWEEFRNSFVSFIYGKRIVNMYITQITLKRKKHKTHNSARFPKAEWYSWVPPLDFTTSHPWLWREQKFCHPEAVFLGYWF